MGGPTSICETVGAGFGRRMDRWTAEQRASKEFGTALQAQTFQRVYSGRHGLKIRAIPTECGRIRSDRLIMRKARVVCQRVHFVVIRMLSVLLFGR